MKNILKSTEIYNEILKNVKKQNYLPQKFYILGTDHFLIRHILVFFLIVRNSYKSKKFYFPTKSYEIRIKVNRQNSISKIKEKLYFKHSLRFQKISKNLKDFQGVTRHLKRFREIWRNFLIFQKIIMIKKYFYKFAKISSDFKWFPKILMLFEIKDFSLIWRFGSSLFL